MGDLRGGFVKPENQLMITLRYLAGGRYQDIKNHHGIAKTTFYDDIVWRVIDAINSADVLRLPGLPVGEEDCARAAAGFQRRSRASLAFRGCVSAVVRCLFSQSLNFKLLLWILRRKASLRLFCTPLSLRARS
ncbi:unnamed protein product [Phaeothamnion confervicola]